MLLENSKHENNYRDYEFHGDGRKVKEMERKELERKKVERKYMERLVGKYCKIVTKEPGEERASVITGILEDVDYEDGFILVESDQGLGCLSINTIVAIKTRYKKIRT